MTSKGRPFPTRCSAKPEDTIAGCFHSAARAPSVCPVLTRVSSNRVSARHWQKDAEAGRFLNRTIRPAVYRIKQEEVRPTQDRSPRDTAQYDRSVVVAIVVLRVSGTNLVR